MYWIQEYDCNKQSRRMYHCDYRTDVAKLPTNTDKGDRDATDTDEAAEIGSYGDRCLCLEDSSSWELRKEPNDWKEL